MFTTKLKLTKPKAEAWVYDGRDHYNREVEQRILCNFEGHGGDNAVTVAELIKKLGKLDPAAVITLDEDHEQSRMAIFASWTERRDASIEEQVEEATKLERELREQAELEAARTRTLPKLDAAVARGKVAHAELEAKAEHERVLAHRDQILAAIEGVYNEINSATSNEEIEDLTADLATLTGELERLTPIILGFKTSKM